MLETAERFHQDLTTQFGLVSTGCEDGVVFLMNLKTWSTVGGKKMISAL